MLPTLIDDLGRAVTSELLDRLRGGEVMSCALVPLSFRIEDEYELQGTVIHLSLLVLLVVCLRVGGRFFSFRPVWKRTAAGVAKCGD